MTFVELQELFLGRLERRLSEASALIDGDADPDRLMRMFHSLAGIAGTYGFQRITDISRDCELLCLSAIDAGRMLTIPEAGVLKEGVVAIERSAACDS